MNSSSQARRARQADWRLGTVCLSHDCLNQTGLISRDSGLCSCLEVLTGNGANEKVDEQPCPHYAGVHAWDADKVGRQAWKVSMEVAWSTSRSPPAAAEAGKMIAGWYLCPCLLLPRLRSELMSYSSECRELPRWSAVDGGCPFARCGEERDHALANLFSVTPPLHFHSNNQAIHPVACPRPTLRHQKARCTTRLTGVLSVDRRRVHHT